jgi:putative two-component system response regulator
MNDKKRLLLVDDDAINLDVLAACLGEEFFILSADCAEAALIAATTAPHPDMILLDVEMPDRNGYDVCRTLKADTATCEIPVIFLTAHDSAADITHGFKVGAVDFIAKPVIPEVLLARVRTHLRLTETRRLLEDQNHHLESLVADRTQTLQKRNEELQHVQELTIIALGALAETRDNETGNHIYRTREYMRAMTEALQTLSLFREQIGADDIEIIWRSAPLHDIGKVGIPDDILLKPGKLSAAEFEVMKRHTALGRNALQSAEQRAGFPDSFLRTATAIAYSHHEHWDGRGYPEGISGRAIPLCARLMAVADVYDALISQRVYKPAFPHDVALDMIRAARGTQFDPDVTDCFLDLAPTMHAIALRFRDST